MKASTSLGGREKGKSLASGARSLFEPLETRLLFSEISYEVTTVADSGPGSLRQAIIAANSNPGYNNVINFDIPGSGVQTIAPLSALPLITSQTSIQGPTDSSGNPLIQIDGHSAGSSSSGLIFARSTPGNNQAAIVSGLTIENFALDGVVIAGQGDVELLGCRLGTDSTGTVPYGNGRDGLRVYSPNNFIGLPYSGAQFMNVIGGNGGNGISLFGGDAANNFIQNNYIGLSATGNYAVGNHGDGIWIDTAGSTIGGSNPQEGNVISGNYKYGIESSTAHGGPNAAGPNQILGNKIGTNAAGNASVPNGFSGIEITAGTGTQIGDSTAGSRNIVSGNDESGIDVGNVTVSIVNDFVGTDATGTKAMGNQGTGISIGADIGSTITSCVVSGNSVNLGGYGGFEVVNSQNISITSCRVGVNAAGNGKISNNLFGIAVFDSSGVVIKNNTIAYNDKSGVYLVGDDSAATIEANSIYSNEGLGIQLGFGTTTLANDAGDTDTGPDGRQNYAILSSAVTGSTGTVVKGTFNGKAHTKIRIDVFVNPTADASGYGQGQRFLGIVIFTTNASGNATFMVTLPKVAVGQFISSTATDAGGNTSEFSKVIKVT